MKPVGSSSSISKIHICNCLSVGNILRERMIVPTYRPHQHRQSQSRKQSHRMLGLVETKNGLTAGEHLADIASISIEVKDWKGLSDPGFELLVVIVHLTNFQCPLRLLTIDSDSRLKREKKKVMDTRSDRCSTECWGGGDAGSICELFCFYCTPKIHVSTKS